MPGNVLDENVVILRFDNSDFEKNTKQSMESLDKLKNSLNEDAGESLKGLSNAANSVNLSGLGKSIDTINSRFSTMGIVGMSAINKLTSSMMSSVSNIVKAIPKQMIQGGWKRALNIEQAEYLMKGLGVKFDGFFDKTTGKFEGVKGAVLASVNDTRYGLDEAAKAAATLLASDEKLADNAELLANRLKAISGVAAVTSSDYQSISYIFTKVAGQGRMMSHELNMLSQRGFNAAVEIRNYLNQNEKVKDQALANAIAMGKQTKKMEEIGTHAKLTEADVREMVSAGAISFDIMSNSLLHFFDTAAGANETYEGSLANVKAAFSRMGAQLEEPKLKNLTKIFNYLLPVLKRFESFIEPFTTKIATFSGKVTDFIGNGLINPLGKALGLKNKDLFHGFAKNVEDAAKKIDESNKKNQKSSDKTKDKLSDLSREYQAARDIWYKGTYGNGQRRKNALEQLGISYQKTQDIINQFYRDGFKWDNIEKQLTKSSEETTKANEEQTESTKEVVQETRRYTAMEAIIKSLVNVLGAGKLAFDGIKNVIATVAGVIRRILTPGVKAGANGFAALTDKLLSAAKRFNEFSKAFRKGLDSKEWREKHKIINTLFTGMGAAILVVKNIITGFIDKIREFFSQFSVSEGFEELKEQLKELLPIIKEFASGKLQKVLDYFKQLSNVGGSKGVSNAVSLFSNMSKGLANFISNTKKGINPLESFIGIFKRVKDSFSFDSLSKAAVNTGVTALSTKNSAIGAVTKASKEIKKAHVSENFTKATDSIVNFFNGISKPAKKIDYKDSFNKILEAFKNADWDKISTIALKVGGLAAMFKTVKDMGDLIHAAAGTLGSISGFFSSLSGIAEAYQSQIKVKTFQVVALSLAILIGAIVALATVPTDRLIPAMAGVLVILGMLIATVTLLNSPKFDPTRMKDIGIAFAGMGGALLMVAAACKILAGIDGDDLFKAGVVITAFIGMFILASKAKGEIAKAGMTFLAMGLAIDALVFAVGAFAIMPWAVILKGAAVVAMIMAELSLAAKIAAKANPSGLLAMAAALDLLIPAIIVFSIMPVDKALRGATVACGIIAMLGLASRAAGKSAGNMMTIFTIATMITSLTAALVILSLIDGKKLIMAASALTGTMTAIAVAAGIANKSKAGIALMALVIGMISASIITITKMDGTKEAIRVATQLSLFAFAMSLAFYVFSKIPMAALPDALLGIALALGIVASIIAIAGGLNKIKGAREFINGGCQLIGEAIGTFFGSIAGSFMSASSKALPQMGANLSAFMEEIKPFIDMAADIDKDSTKGIQNLASAIVNLTKAEFLDQLSLFGGSSSITNFATELTTFAQGFVDFSKIVNKIKDDSVDKITKITTIISKLVISANKIPKTGGLAEKITGRADIESFIDGILSIAKALGNNGKGIGLNELKIPKDLLGDNGKITKIVDVMSALATASKKLPKSGGLQQGLTGNTTLAEFGGQLASFASSFSTFLTSDIDVDDKFLGDDGIIAKICSVISTMVTAANKIPDTGGLVSVLKGDNTLNRFAWQLASMVPTLKYFINQVGSENFDLTNIGKVSQISEAVKQMALAAKKIPDIGGVKGAVFGGKDLGKFARQLAKFIPGFNEFSKGVGNSEISDDVLNKIPKITTAISAMAQVAKSLPKSGGWAQKLVGEKNLGKFGGQLKTLLSSLSGVELNVDVSALKNAGDGLSAIVPSLKIFRDAMPIPAGENLASLGKNAASFAGSLSGDITKGLSKKASSISSAVTELGKAAKKGAKSLGQTSGFKAAGKSLGGEFASGIAAKKKDAHTAGSSLGKRAVSGAKSKDIYNSMYNGGKHVANGFVKGIKDKKQSAYDAGYALGRAAKKGQKDATKESSPAKEFIKGGRFAGEGLVIGLKSYNRKAYKAGYQLGDQTVIGQLDGITHAIDDISDPIITPVIDLSRVERGLASLDNDFSRNSAVGINTRFEAADVRTNNILSEVVKSMNKLNNQNQANNYYNITVDGAENPEEFANRFLREIQLEVRTG